MKTAIIVLSVFLAAGVIIIFMQWNTIKKLTPIVASTNNTNDNTTTQDDGAKSLGEMAAAIKKAGGSFKTQIDF